MSTLKFELLCKCPITLYLFTYSFFTEKSDKEALINLLSCYKSRNIIFPVSEVGQFLEDRKISLNKVKYGIILVLPLL